MNNYGKTDNVETAHALSLRFIIMIILNMLFLVNPVSGQDKKASVLLSSAIYEEEVSGNLDKAIELYRDILKTYPDDRPVAAKALYHLGLVNEKMGRQKANEYYNQLINNYPEQKDMVTLAKAKMARIDRSSNDIDREAEQHFAKAEELLNQWQYDYAICEYDTVIRLVPNTNLALEARYWTGLAQFRSGKTEESLLTIQTLLKEHPDSPMAPVAELMVKQLQQAISSAKRVPVNRITDKGKILDPETGIQYTRVKSFGGKNDDALRDGIYGISDNFKFLLGSNHVISMDSLDPVKLFDIPSSYQLQPCRLNPDCNMVAFFDMDTLKLIPVSTENGHPSGQVITPRDGDHNLIGRYVNWSPDGSCLAFSRIVGTNRDDIWTYSISDGVLTQITNTPEAEWCLLYSPDGKNILYRHGDYPRSSMRKSPAGGGPSELVLESGYFPNPIWTRDQRYLFRGLNGKIGILRLQDQQQFQVNLPPEVGRFYNIQTDDQSLFFLQDSPEIFYSIKVVSPSGGRSMEVKGSSNQVYGSLNWTPDNRMIITTIKSNKDSTYIIQLIPTTGEDPVVVDGTDGKNYKYLSPDCSRFADIIYNPEALSNHLRIVPISLREAKVAGSPVILDNKLEGLVRPRLYWSPDGSKISISLQGDIWIFPTDGSDPYNLTNSPESETQGSWSPDGRMITIGFGRGNQRVKKIVDVSSGQVIQTWVGSYCENWSPDGMEIAMFFYTGWLSVLNIETGKIRELANWKALGLSDVFEVSWSPDGRQIAIVGNLEANQDSYHIFLLNSTGGQANEIDTDENGYISTINWSPDGKWIAYSSWVDTKVRLESTLWRAELKDFLEKVERR